MVSSFLTQRPRQWVIFVVLSICTTALYLWNLPDLFSFFTLSFRDSGSNLMLVKLLHDGQRPTIDFGYAYGLLSVLLSQVWLSIFGITPTAFVSSIYILALLYCYWFSRFLTAIGVGYLHLGLLILLWPFAMPPVISYSHAIEPVLLMAALALYMEEKAEWALAVCTICLFVKPSMAYLFGLVLVIILVVQSRPPQPGALRRLVRAFAPSVLAGLIIGVFLGAYYGWGPLVSTLTAEDGHRAYRIDHYGVLGYGRSFFWNPSWKYYLGQAAGFWIFSMLSVIGVAAGITVSRLRTRKTFSKRDVLICSIALLLLAFHVFFYGPPESWIYYVFLLVIFWVLMIDRQRLRWLICVALLLYLTTTFITQRGHLRYWRTVVTSPLTHGLATDPQTFEEWRAVFSLSKRYHVTILSFGGASALFFPEMETAPRLFLDPGLSQPREADAALTSLQHADYVVWPSGFPYLNYRTWPGLGDELRKFQTVSKTERFTVLRRSSLSSTGGSLK